MKLYVLHGSGNCRKVHGLLHQLGMTAEVVGLDMSAGEQRAPAFLAINPNGMVPALVDGALKLWESNAILQYLANKAGAEDLYPRDAARRADIDRWLAWEQAHFAKGVGPILFENLAKPLFDIGPIDEARVAASTELFHRFAPVLEQQLDGRDFITGETLSIADFSLGAAMIYAERGKLPWDAYPHIKAWSARLEALPAMAASAAHMV